MEFNDKDFNKLTYRVHENDPDADFFKLFPVFSLYPVFTAYHSEGVDVNHLLRYIVYCFDKNSPLLTLDNLFERRVHAAKLAGFVVDDKGKFAAPVEDVLLSRDFGANCMIIQYCIMHAGEEYTTFVTFQDALRKQLEALMSDDDEGDSKKDTIANIQKLREDLRTTRENIFRFKNDSFLTDDLYAFMETRKLRISPEDWAVMLNEKEVVLNVAKSIHQAEEELRPEVDEKA